MVLKEMQGNDITFRIALNSIPMIKARVSRLPVVIDSPFRSLEVIVKVYESIVLRFRSLQFDAASLHGAPSPIIILGVIVRMNFLKFCNVKLQNDKK